MRYPGRKGADGALEGDAIDGAGELGITGAKVTLGCVFLRRVDGLFERDELQSLLAEVHEDEIDGEAMQPGGEGGLSAEGADLAEEVEEGLLGHVFGFGDVAEHAETEGVDAALVEGVELGKGLSVAVFCGFDGLCFACDGRIAFERARHWLCLIHGLTFWKHLPDSVWENERASVRLVSSLSHPGPRCSDRGAGGGKGCVYVTAQGYGWMYPWSGRR